METNKKQLTANKLKKKQKRILRYKSLFLIPPISSARDGKVVYISPEYHERLLRIVQISRKDKVTLYSLIDNILKRHFEKYGKDITAYYNQRNKPII